MCTYVGAYRRLQIRLSSRLFGHHRSRWLSQRSEVSDRSGMLLAEGIGDTLRVSLAADPVQEVKVGYDILRSLGIRSRGINFIACPSCSRQNFDVIKTMNELEMRLEDVPTKLDVAVIGCIVNGPGEAKEADIGLTGGTPNNLLYVGGSPAGKVKNEELVDQLERQIREKVAEKQAQEAQVIAKG